jgi:hypothetical protein
MPPAQSLLKASSPRAIGAGPMGGGGGRLDDRPPPGGEMSRRMRVAMVSISF